MEIRQLQLFLAVMDAPTLTQAAARVHLSPAAVSVRLHALAEELETELFIRSGRRLAPTPAARWLEVQARKLVGDFTALREALETRPETDARPFRFATGATTLIYRLRGPLRRLRRRYPRLDLHVNVLATEEIVGGLLSRDFDLGLISLPYADARLQYMPLFEEELLIVRPRPAGGPATFLARAADLQSAAFLLYPPQSNMRGIMDRFFRDLGIAPRVTMEAADTEVIKSLVLSGFGYSILPEHALRVSRGRFQVLRLAGQRLARRQALAIALGPHGRPLTQAIAAFLRDALNHPGRNGTAKA